MRLNTLVKPFFLIVILGILTPVHAGETTRLEWKFEREMSWCYSVNPTTGESKPLPDKACLSILPKTKFEWRTKVGAGLSMCYEVDQETGGKKYQIIAANNSTECSSIKPKTKYDWVAEGRGMGCYEVDLETGGRKFIKPMPSTRPCPTLNPNTTIRTLGQQSNTNSNINDSRMQKAMNWIGSVFDKSNSPSSGTGR